MSTEKNDKPADAKPEGGTPSKLPPIPKSSPIMAILKLVIPAAFAAAAAYGGTHAAAAKGGAGHGEAAAAHAPVKPPGPTLALDAFLVTLFDANKKPHPMKMTLAIEFDATSHDDPKTFTPRIRDAFLAHLRSLSFEQATDASHFEKLRGELVERARTVGAQAAEKVLVTDFVVQ